MIDRDGKVREVVDIDTGTRKYLGVKQNGTKCRKEFYPYGVEHLCENCQQLEKTKEMEGKEQKMKSGQKAKAWCFDNGITEAQVQASWDNAIAQDNFVITNMEKHGRHWHDLPAHLLEQLVERY